MVNVVSTQVIIDGPRNAVVKVTGILDTSDVAPVVIANPATMIGMDDTGLRRAAGLLIKKVTFDVEPTLEVRLSWEATVPVTAIVLIGSEHQKFVDFGGLPNNSGAGRTGSIQLSTQGWTAGIMSFTVVLELVKEGRPHVP